MISSSFVASLWPLRTDCHLLPVCDTNSQLLCAAYGTLPLKAAPCNRSCETRQQLDSDRQRQFGVHCGSALGGRGSRPAPMYVEHWDSFRQQAESLFRSRPLHTRYILKYRNRDAKLVLKVTDDVQCYKFVTDQQSDLKRVEALNKFFFKEMSCGPSASDAEPMETEASEAILTEPANPQKSQRLSKKNNRRG